jgi:GAF domain-containing protein/DNA-binding LacI/PurR family transcriptional regulator
MEKKNIEEKPKSNLEPRKTIGLLLENMVGWSEYQVNFWAGVVDKAKELDINLICFAGETLGYSPHNKFTDAQNIVYDLASLKNVDGLIISGTLGTYINEADFTNFFSHFKSIPVVSTVVSLPGIPAVMVDNEKGMRELLTHLIQEHGHKRIGFIRGPKDNPDAEQRYEAYKKVLGEHNIRLDESIVVDGDFMSPSGAAAVDVLLRERMANFDVLVAANDNMALGALEALQQWGIHVPGKMAVVGFDDDNTSRNITPSLTTVHHPKYEQGKKAAEMLADLLVGEKVPHQVILPTSLILRETCGCVDHMVAQAKVGLKTKAGATIKIALAASREKILSEIQDKLPNISSTELDQVDRVVRGFYGELKDETNPIFLSTLDDALRQASMADNSNLALWHDVISSMRRNVLPHIGEEQMLFRAEDLWQQARVVISKRARRVEGYHRLQAQEWAGKLSEINQALATTSDEDELMNILIDKLPDLGIAGCYLSLYENPVMPTEQCRLALAYKKEAGRVNPNPGDEIFPAWQLTPRNALSQNRSYSLIVEPLCFQENQLGIVVFEMGPKDWAVYETLRRQISSALWGAHFTQLIRSLYEASSSVLSLQEPQAILDDVVKKACNAVGAKGANIIFIDKKQPHRLAIGANHGSAFYTSTLISVEPILIEDMRIQNGLPYQQMYKEGIGAAGCFPLLVRGKTVGVMWIFFEKPHRFALAEVEALRLYVNQAAIAYDKAKRMKELEHLQQASEKLAGVADVREVLQQIAESARDVLQADSVAIWPYDAIRHTFLPDELVTQGIDEEWVQRSKLDKPSVGGTAEFVIREGYLAVSDVNDARYEYLDPQAHRLRGEIGVKSFQGIVLKVGNEVLGVLYVDYKVSRGFDDEEEATLKTFAHHAALALKKARLLKQVRRAYDTATVVAEVSVQEDLQSTLDAIVKGTLDAFQCDAVTLNSYNPVTNELGYPPAMSGVKYPERVQSSKGKVEINSILYEMLQRKEPYVVDAVAQNADFKGRRFVEEEEIKSCVAIRLDAAGQKVGIMFVNYRSPHHFTGQEIADIKLFANQAAVAIRNAQLHDDATRKTKYLQALYDAGQAVTSTLTLDEILNHIAEQASLLTAHQGQQPIFCNLVLKENNILTVKVSYSASHVSSLVEKGYIIDLEGNQRIGVVGRVVKTGKTQLVPDVTKDPDYISGTQETKSLVAVPIIIGEDVIGVIAVGYSSYGAFDEENQVCLESLSTQAALAIRNAQLYDDATRKAKYLQALYDAGKAVTSTLALDEMLNQIVKQASQLTQNMNGTQARFCYLALKENDQLKFKASYTASHVSSLSEQQEYIIDLGHDKRIGIVGRAARAGKSQLVFDVTNDTDYIAFNKETRSLLAVPIIIGEDVIGVIVVEHSNYNAFGEEDRDYLESLSTQAALAIRNAQLYEKATTRATYLQALYDAGKTVTGTLTLDEILKHIVEQASLVTAQKGQQAQICYLALHQDGKLSFKAAYPPDHQSRLTEKGYMIDLEHEKRIGIVGRAVKTGRSCLVPDVSKDQDYRVANMETRSELAVPILLHGDVIGVIDVEHSELDAFDLEDAQALEALADQAAIAIRNARHVKEIEQRALQMQTASEVARDAASILNIKQLLDQAVKLISDCFHFYHAAIYLPEEEEYVTLKAASSQGGQKNLAEGYKLKVGGLGIIAHVARTSEPYIVLDVDKDAHFLKNPYLADTHSEMALPLRIHGQLIGVLDVQSSEPNTFSTEDITALQMMADQLAIAIDNARQFEELKKTKEYVGAMMAVTWMGTVAGAWRHAIGNQATIIGDLVKHIRGDISANNVNKRLVEIEEVIAEIRKVPMPPLSAEEGTESVFINKLVIERVKQLQSRNGYDKVSYETKCDLSDSATVRASSEWLRRVLDILVDNSVNAMTDTPVKRLTVITRSVNGILEIVVTDTGRGIPEDVRSSLFQKAVYKPIGAKGMGLGLFLAQAIVQTYNGNIVIGSTSEIGTTMIIQLQLER